MGTRTPAPAPRHTWDCVKRANKAGLRVVVDTQGSWSVVADDNPR